MSSSNHSRNSSSDEGEKEVVYRECDDMLARRIAGNLPAPLRKKKYEDNYKRFITPSGNPMNYVRQHMRSQSLSDTQEENAAKEQERDERNIRYEEMQELKIKLKEEEDTWTSNLDNWKQRRRSATLDVRKRKEDRDSIIQQSNASSRRRAKTYREIIEEKKKRDSWLFDYDYDDYTSSVFSNSTDRDTDKESTITSKKLPYRGAVSVPNVTNNYRSFSLNSSNRDTEDVVKPVKHTAQVTAAVDHTSSKSEDSSDSSKKQEQAQSNTQNKEEEFTPKDIKSIWPPPRREISPEKISPSMKLFSRPVRSVAPPVKYVSPVKSASPPVKYDTPPVKSVSPPVKSVSPPVKSVSPPIKPVSPPVAPFCSAAPPSVNSNNVRRGQASVSRPRSQSPPPSSYRPTASVVMRQKAPHSNRQRPKSAYSGMGERASTLPRNYHEYSAPKTSGTSTSSFVQFRKSAFANKRHMWENIGHNEPQAPRGPQHLASLLKHDTEKLQRNEAADEEKAIQNGVSTSHYKNEDEALGFKETHTYDVPQTHSWQRAEATNKETEHKPKIMSQNNTSNATNNAHASWLRSDQQSTQLESKPGYQRVKAPLSRASWSKTATLPTKMRPTPPEERADLSKPQPAEAYSISPNRSRLAETSSAVAAAQKSPRSPPSSTNSLFDDMKICINQRPKSEKGFGFTVRGGDEGKPVIVNAVSPGGAADVCQLCVGDEILAINEVKLSSSLTQDGIVQLIVDSVITGNLSLDIRRYGKLKKNKTYPPRLAGSKVVKTSGGFVQVRSDKGGGAVISTKSFNGNFTNDTNGKAESQDESFSSEDLPSPPPVPSAEFPNPSKKSFGVDGLSSDKTSFTAYRHAGPLSDLIGAAKSTAASHEDEENNGRRKSPDTVNDFMEQRYYTSDDDDDDLQFAVMKAQHELDMEESYLNNDRRQHEVDLKLREQLLEEQRLIDEREARREEEKRRRIEEARAEEKKVEEELRRIEAAKIEQQKRREDEKRRLMRGPPASGETNFSPTFNQTEMNHWLIEEAERARAAEEEGRERLNALDYSKEINSRGASLSDDVIQQLTQGNLPRRVAHQGNPHLPGSLRDHWNDPSTQATLL